MGFSQSVTDFNFSDLGGPRGEMRKDSPENKFLSISFPIKRADPKEFSCSSISHPVAPSPLLIVRSLEGSKGLVVVVGRPWRVETPVEAQVEGARDILAQVGRPLVVVVVVVEPLLVESVHTLFVTEQARLQNALLKRRSICREVKISRRRLVGDQWQLEPTRCRGGLT